MHSVLEKIHKIKYLQNLILHRLCLIEFLQILMSGSTYDLFCCEYISISSEVVSKALLQSSSITGESEPHPEQLWYCVHCCRFEVSCRSAHRVQFRVPALFVHIITSGLQVTGVGLQVHTALGVITFSVAESVLDSLPISALHSSLPSSHPTLS